MANLKDIELKNAQTGAIDSLSADEATVAIAQGTHSPQAGIMIPTRGRDGAMYLTPSEELAKGIQESGLSLASQTDAKAASEGAYKEGVAASKEKRFGDTGGQIATGLTGLASSITLGGTDVIASAAGAGDAVRTAAEVNPKSRIAGEIAGAFVPGGGSLANAAGLAVKGAISAQKAGAAARIAAKLAAGATEGAIQGAGVGISNAALREGELSKEDLNNFIQAVSVGSLLGGGLSGAGGIIGETYAKVGPKIGEAVQSGTEAFRKNVASKIISSKGTRAEAEQLANLPSPAWGMTGPELGDAIAAEQRITKNLTRQEKDAVAALKAEKKAAEAQAKAIPGEIKKILKGVDDNQAESLAQAVDETGNVVSGIKSLYTRSKSLYDQADEAANAALSPPSRQEALSALVSKLKTELSSYPKIIAAVEQSSADIGKINRVVDEFGQIQDLRKTARVFMRGQGKGTKSSIYRPLKEFTDGVTEVLKSHPEQEIASLYQKSDELYSASQALSKGILGSDDKIKGPIGPKDVQKAYAKVTLDPSFGKLIETVALKAPDLAPEIRAFAQAGNNIKAQAAALKSASDTINALRSKGDAVTIDEMRDAFNAIGANKNAMTRLDALKELSAKLANQTDRPDSAAAQLKAVREALGNQVSSPVVRGAKILDAARKKSIEQLSGSRVNDGLIYSIVASVFKPATATVLLGLKHLSAVRQDVYKQAQIYRGIRSAVEAGRNAVDASLNKVVSTLDKSPARRAITQGALSLTNFDRDVEEIRKVADSVAENGDVIAARIAPYQGIPEVQERLAAHTANTAQFLATKIPQPTVRQENSFLPPKTIISDAQKTKFYRYVRAAEDPTTVMDSISEGRVTPEEIETLQALSPELYEKLKAGIIEKLTTPGIEIPYARRLNLSTVFNVAGDPSLTRTQFSMLQASYAPAPDKGGRPPAPRNDRSTETTAESTQSETDRLTFS